MKLTPSLNYGAKKMPLAKILSLPWRTSSRWSMNKYKSLQNSNPGSLSLLLSATMTTASLKKRFPPASANNSYDFLKKFETVEYGPLCIYDYET